MFLHVAVIAAVYAMRVFPDIRPLPAIQNTPAIGYQNNPLLNMPSMQAIRQLPLESVESSNQQPQIDESQRRQPTGHPHRRITNRQVTRFLNLPPLRNLNQRNIETSLDLDEQTSSGKTPQVATLNQSGNVAVESHPGLHSELEIFKSTTSKDGGPDGFDSDNDFTFDRECDTCREICGMDKTTHCEAGHEFCFKCAESYAKVWFMDQKFDLPCMYSRGFRCEFLFEESEICRFVKPGLLKMRDENRERKRSNVEFYDCPNCNSRIRSGNAMDTFQCNECDLEFCKKCLKHHELSQTSCTVSELSAEQVKAETQTQAYLRKCPTCDLRVFKDQGCNHMQCPTCGTDFCYVCKEKIFPNSHYFLRVPGRDLCLHSEPDETKLDLRSENDAKRAGEEFDARNSKI